jgi:hypothetical protein
MIQLLTRNDAILLIAVTARRFSHGLGRERSSDWAAGLPSVREAALGQQHKPPVFAERSPLALFI